MTIFSSLSIMNAKISDFDFSNSNSNFLTLILIFLLKYLLLKIIKKLTPKVNDQVSQ